MATQPTKLTPKEVAVRWRCKPDKIRALIRSGQLAAFDVSMTPGTGRPRFLIDFADLIAFEERRRVHKPAPSRPRRHKPLGIIEFF